MSTFLDNGNILIKILHRFLIFSDEGSFINEVHFSDYKSIDTLVLANQQYSLPYFCEQNRIKKNNENTSFEIEHQHGLKNFNGLPYKPIFQKEMDKSQFKMELINFSYDNKYFLFFDNT